jgi:hypothetical protein
MFVIKDVDDDCLAFSPELYEQFMNSSCELHIRSYPIVSGTRAARVVVYATCPAAGEPYF